MFLALSVADVNATDHPQIATQLLLKGGAGRESLRWSSRVPLPPLPMSNPVAVGATLLVTDANGVVTSLPLPAAGWSTSRDGMTYVFKNAAAPAGLSVVRSVRLRQGKSLQLVAKSTGVSLDEAAQGSIGIALVVGDDVYCSRCTTPAHDEPGRYVAKQCPAPADCSPPPPAAVCGNAVAEPPSEECDGSDLGMCTQFPPPFPIACDGVGSPTPCTCCGISDCLIQLGQPTRCCGGAACQDVTGVGQVRGGKCIPPSCSAAADCNGYQCVGGTCCGDAGDVCGTVGCCPGAGVSCTTVPWIGAPVCCRAAGAVCTEFRECCSGSCTGGLCD